MEKIRIAFATDNGMPGLSSLPESRDDLAAQELQKEGLHVDSKVWDDPQVKWNRYDAIIIRSTFDYIFQIEKFYNWLDSLMEKGISVFNPVEILRKNVDKNYLAEFAEQGIRIPPSRFIRRGGGDDCAPSLQEVLQETGWEKAVIKPCVGCSSHQVILVRCTEDAKQKQAEFENMLTEGDIIFQRFVPDLEKKGEMAIVFFNRKFSHAVYRFPMNNFPGVNTLSHIAQVCHPPEEMLSMAEAVLNLVDGDLLYARVDIVEDSDGQLYLMELELTEPDLFFGHDPMAPARFKTALKNLMMK